MKTQNTPTRVNKFWLATLSALTAATCLFGSIPNAKAEDAVIDGSKIFTEVKAGVENEVKDDDLGSVTLRRSLIAVDIKALKEVLSLGQGRRVRLNVFPDRPLDVIFDSVEVVSPENIVSTGRVADDKLSAVSLAINNGIVVANIDSPAKGARYEIRPAGRDLHAVREQGADTATDCGTIDNTADR